MSNDVPDIDQDVEFVRRKAKLQVGDGVDARGEVTTEMVRVIPADDREDNRSARDEFFGDFAMEVQRSVRLTKNELGISDED